MSAHTPQIWGVQETVLLVNRAFVLSKNKEIAKGGCKKNAIKGGVSVCLRLSTFARVCLCLLAFSPLRLLAFVSVCLRLFAFARICLRPPLLRPPLRDTEKKGVFDENGENDKFAF